LIKHIIKERKNEKLNNFESINNKGMRIKFKSFCIRISILILFLSSCKESPNIEIPNLESRKGLLNRSLLYQNQIREYILYIPQSYSEDKPIPVMLNFHGFGGTAQRHLRNADMRKLSESEGFILIYPQGTLLGNYPHWNPSSIGEGNKSSADDLGFIDKLLTTLPEKINIDTSRIYACGYSNGGFFSYGLACNLNSQIAAIGSVAGTMVSDTYENCQATVPKPMINIHGVNDPIVPYEGAPGLVSINNVLNFWSKLNFAENMEINFFEGVENYVYRDSLETPMVSHFKIINGGHTWDYNSFLSSNTSTNELIWEFVSKFDINGYID